MAVEREIRRAVEAIVREPGVLPRQIQVVPLDHPPTDDDFAEPVDAHHIVIDTATPALWARVGGIWLSAALA